MGVSFHLYMGAQEGSTLRLDIVFATYLPEARRRISSSSLT